MALDFLSQAQALVSLAARDNRTAEHGLSLCASCLTWRPIGSFPLSQGGFPNRSAPCANCRRSSALSAPSRDARVVSLSDGTATAKRLARMLSSATHCPYCGISLDVGQAVLDHMEPIARGGAHSARNLIACCADCNGRKLDKPFRRWVDDLEPPYGAIAARIYRQRFGRLP
jgi:hypothetical protein